MQALQRRGLKGMELFVSDDHVGLRAARRAVFPSMSWQRCQFHLAQNAQAHAHNRAQAREMGQAIRDIFNSPSLVDAEAMVIRVVGIFPNQASVLRLTSAVFAEIHEEWLTGQQYLNLNDCSVTEKPDSQTNYRKSVA